MDDDSGLGGVGFGMLTNLHGLTLRPANLTGVKTRVLTPFAQYEPTITARDRGCVVLIGEQPGSPSGVVTFLFTDIEGSTRRWEADAEAMRAALVVHDEILRSVIEAHGGWLFKHTGDGVCSAFGSARAAIDAAAAAQRA